MAQRRRFSRTSPKLSRPPRKNAVVLADTGSANAYAAENAVPFSALPTTSGVSQTLMIEHTNTGASTYAPDGLPASPIFGAGGVALQGGGSVAAPCHNQVVCRPAAQWRWPLLGAGGVLGARARLLRRWPVRRPCSSRVAVLGTAHGLVASLTAAGLAVTFTAAAVVAKTALNGAAVILSNFNQTLNVGGVGAGAWIRVPARVGYIGIYAIYNPTSGAQSVLATNATAAAVPEQYAGGSMPAGFTYSQLIGVWPTNGSGSSFLAASVIDA